MFDIVIEKIKNLFKSRLLPIVIIYLLLCFALIQRIFTIQIIEGEKHQIDAQQKITKERELKGTRGNIRDMNGKLLAYNELSYSVTYEDTGELSTNEEKNAMIYKVIKIIEENDGVLADDFFIQQDKNGNLVFQKEGSAQLRFKRDVYSLNSVDKLTDEQKKQTATEVFNYMRHGEENSKNKMYDIADTYSMEDALKIMMVRYNILMNKYSRYLPITIASDVNDATVATIKESKEELPGVDILTQSHRVYNDSKYFAHILGYTGLISPEKLEEFIDKGIDTYSATDQIGITGVEKEYEKYLHGKNGSETVVVNDQTRVLEILKTNEPAAGNDVYLTIDADLQKTCYDLLERRIASVLLNALRPGNAKSKVKMDDVFYALFNNGVIDITKLNEDDSTALEKSVYKKFQAEQKVVFRSLKRELSIDNKTATKSLSKEKKEYISYIYKMLKEQKILLTSQIPEDDATLASFNDEKISMSTFLKYAISNNYIDLNKLDVGKEYYSTEELYEKLLDYIIDTLRNDSKFNKIIYHSLVYSYKISGKEICLLLFDQSVLKYDEKAINGLEASTITPSSFILSKIRNLEITPAQLALEPCSGSLIVTDVKTGEVRALVSYPGYDNNKLANRVDSEYFTKLMNDNSLPIINRPLQQKTAPGSTYKMVSSVAGLEEGVIGLDEKIPDSYEFTKISPAPKDHTRNSHGKVDVPNALEVSCNHFYYEVGYRLSLDSNRNFKKYLGLNKLEKYARMFGFGEKSGIELPEAEPQIAGGADGEAVRAAIGQSNNNYTPAQLAHYVTSIANNGTRYKLTIFNKVQDINNKVIKHNKAKIMKEINIKNTTWDRIHDGMYKVVNGEDSAIKKLYKDFDVVVAGKTGTAQQVKTKPNHALFVSYAPYENPEISVVAVIPNGYTSSNAAELVRDVYKYYYKQDGYKKLLKGKVALPELSSGISD